MNLRHRQQHLHLRLAVLVPGQHVGQRAFRVEQGGHGHGVVGGRLDRSGAPREAARHRWGRFGIRIRRGEGVGEKARDRPVVRSDEREHRLLDRLIEPDGLFAQPQQELAGRIGIVQRPMRPRLREPVLGRQQGQAVAGRPRQEDACDVQRVEDLVVRVPQACRLEKLDVQPRAVAHGLAALEEPREPAQGVVRAGGTSELLLLDPGQAQDGVRDRPAGVDQLLQGRGDVLRSEGHRADFDDPVARRVETGRLEV